MTREVRELRRLIPTPWSLEEFVDRVAARNGRPIELVPWPFPAHTGGGRWMPWPTPEAPAKDVVFYDEMATGGRREAIVAHELAHIVLRHDAVRVSNEHIAPNVPSDLRGRYLNREDYETGPERVAESFATALVDAISRHRRRPPPAGTLDRIDDQLR